MQVHFYATRDDQVDFLEAVRSRVQFKYVLTGLFFEPSPTVYSDPLSIPTLGVAGHESAANGDNYLVVAPDSEIGIKEVRQYDGSMRYSISQELNPSSIVFLHGGFYGRTLLYGRIGTISKHQQSIFKYRLFCKELRSHFKKYGAYYTGKGALGFAKSGGRLTIAVQSPPEFDFSLVT